ncbi:hypothetical protein [Streptomyces sp. Y7]|uniref:hypothetical protein n=1 Tax=Streptomyces sp. Y7 TaxID=3342392 RepID=UPI0037152A20
MNDFQDRGPVQQVVYRWDGNHGRQGTGMNAVAHSCDAERAEELGRELGPLLWVSGAAAARPSVVRTLSGDGAVLLVQRWPTTDRGGRPSTVSHVLVGDRGTLKVRQCLGLAYGGWSSREKAETVSGKKDPIESAKLDALALKRLPEMLDRLPSVNHALTLTAAEWLRDPSQRLSLLLEEEKGHPGWPDQNAVPLVYLGLFLLFGPWLEQQWTFATYDTADSHPLRLTSVPRWEPDTGGSGPLARVRGGRPAGSRFELWAGSALVRHLLAHPGADAGVPQLVDELRGGAALDWERRRARLKQILGTDRTPPNGTRIPAPAPAPRAGEPGEPGRRPGAGRVAPEQSVETPVRDRDRGDRDRDRDRGDRDRDWDRDPARAAVTSEPNGTAYASEAYAEPPRPDLPAESRTDPYTRPGLPTESRTDPYARPDLPAEPRPDPYARPHTHAHPHPHPHPHPHAKPAPTPSPPTPAPPTPSPPSAPPPVASAHHLHQPALHRDLCGFRRGDGMGQSMLLAELRGQPDEVLLHELRTRELPAQSVELLLDVLADPHRADARPLELRHELCAEVLENDLYFTPHGPGADGRSGADRASRAARLFGWAVAPLARDERHLRQLQELLYRLSRDPHPTTGNWLRQSIIDPPGGRVPDLPPVVWSRLLSNALTRIDKPPQSVPPPVHSLPSPHTAQAPMTPPAQPPSLAPGSFMDRLLGGWGTAGCLLAGGLGFCAVAILIVIVWFLS